MREPASLEDVIGATPGASCIMAVDGIGERFADVVAPWGPRSITQGFLEMSTEGATSTGLVLLRLNLSHEAASVQSVTPVLLAV